MRLSRPLPLPRLAAALTLAGASVCVLHGYRPAAAGCAHFQAPHFVHLNGTVGELVPGGFTVDRLRVVVATPAMRLRWLGDHVPIAVDAADIVPGNSVYVAGSLQADGTVLAVGVEAEDGWSVPVVHVGGTLEELGADFVTVAGEKYFVPADPDTPFPVLLGRDRQLALGALRVGDAVVFGAVRDETTGRMQAGELSVHPSGDGTTFTGVVTSTDAEAYGEFFGASGTFLEIDGTPAFVPFDFDAGSVGRDESGARWVEDAARWLSEEDRVGAPVHVAGRMRDGTFFVEGLAPLPRGAARRSGRAEIDGIVTDSTPTAIEVNGLSIELPQRLAAKARESTSSSVGVGDRVRIKVRTQRDGAMRVRQIRAR